MEMQGLVRVLEELAGEQCDGRSLIAVGSKRSGWPPHLFHD